METVRICRLCGHTSATDVTGRCESCGGFIALDRVSRSEAQRIVRRLRLKRLLRRLLWLVVILVPIGIVTIWVLRIFFDVAPNPPRATTDLNALTGPHTWSQFRRTPQNVGFTTDAAPSPPHRVRWTFRSDKPLHASPTVVDDHVYLTTEDGRAVALERHTGQLIWQYHTGWLSSSTPAVVDDAVIVAIRPGTIFSLNRQTGTLRWETDLGHPLFVLTSPLVAHGSIYIGAADGKLHALDAATGLERWAFETKDWILSTAAYTDGRVLVLSQDTLLYVIGANTGRRRFIYPTGRGRHLTASPVIQGERAYIGATGGRISALAWRNRTFPWDSKLRLWKSRLFLWGILKSPPEQKGRVWSTRLDADVTHPPAIADQSLYVATIQGKVVALEMETGTVRWTSDLGSDITSAPIVAGHTVLVGTLDGRVVALATQSGEQLWVFKTNGQITGSPIVVEDTMYVASHDGILYAVTGVASSSGTSVR